MKTKSVNSKKSKDRKYLTRPKAKLSMVEFKVSRQKYRKLKSSSNKYKSSQKNKIQKARRKSKKLPSIKNVSNAKRMNSSRLTKNFLNTFPY